MYLYREDVKSEDLRITYLNTLHDINYAKPAPLSNIIINNNKILISLDEIFNTPEYYNKHLIDGFFIESLRQDSLMLFGILKRRRLCILLTGVTEKTNELQK